MQPPRRKENPEFPLRGFVRCAACGRPLTASNSRGKLGKTYPDYRCWRKGCGAAQVRAERLEQSFSDLLRSAEVSPGTMRLVKGTLLDLWQDLRAESGQQTATAQRRITELERRKQRLVQAYVYDQAIDRPPRSAASNRSSSPKASPSTEKRLESQQSPLFSVF